MPDTTPRTLRAQDIAIGTRFGSLVTATVAWPERHGHVVACMCDCGGTAIVRIDALRGGQRLDCRARVHRPLAG